MKTTKKTATKATKTAKTSKKVEAKAEDKAMTYGQVNALTNALYHSNPTKAEMSEKIDKTMSALGLKPNGKGMDEEKKAQWLKEHGSEPATYGQCKMLALCLFQGKASYAQISDKIAELDKANGYVRSEPKAEEAKKVVEDTNKAEAKKQPKAKATKKSSKKSQANA